MSPITWVDPQVALLRQILAELTGIRNELAKHTAMMDQAGTIVITDADWVESIKECDQTTDAALSMFFPEDDAA